MNPIFVALGTVSMFAGTATAQLVGPGMSWSGSSGNFTGSYVPSCQNLPVTIVSPETITLTIWGELQSPFGLFASLGGSQCITIPGIGGGIVLDFPVVPVASGLLTQMTPCLSCPPGHENLQIPVPPGLPPGTSLALQAISVVAGNWSFTVAITGTT